MTTYADNYTSRVRGDYIACGIPHRLQVRAVPTSLTEGAAEAIAEVINNYILSFEAQLSTDWAWQGWAYASANSETFIPFVPVLSDTVAGAVNFNDISPRRKVTAANHAARSATSTTRIYFFGLIIVDSAAADAGGNGVLTPAEVGGLSGATGIVSGSLASASGELATFYNRLTYKVNDRLFRLVKRGLI